MVFTAETIAIIQIFTAAFIAAAGSYAWYIGYLKRKTILSEKQIIHSKLNSIFAKPIPDADPVPAFRGLRNAIEKIDETQPYVNTEVTISLLSQLRASLKETIESAQEGREISREAINFIEQENLVDINEIPNARRYYENAKAAEIQRGLEILICEILISTIDQKLQFLTARPT